MGASGHTVRDDIQGLRAIAVLAVLCGHMMPSALTGGFCGVDVFFVISGYLIGRHLLEDIEAGHFSFLGFYGRRARRILPALTTVLVAVLGFGWLILSGPELIALGRHIAAAAVFSNNILLWSEAGYFDAAATTKPLLHLWSLGVEEQFYLLVPLMLWVGARGRRSSIRWALRLSIASMLIAILADAPRFYLLDARFWELGLGVGIGYLAMREQELSRGTLMVAKARYQEFLLYCLALMFIAALLLGAQRGAAPNARPFAATLGLVTLFALSLGALQLAGVYRDRTAWSTLMAFCARHGSVLRAAVAGTGLALIAASFLLMGPGGWPGPQTLFPVLGTAFVIAAGARTPVNRLLALRPLTFVGGISYPLYLWHWPALVFWKMLPIDRSAPALLVPLGVAFLLAWATSEWIEKPVRCGWLGREAMPLPPAWAISIALLLPGILGVSAVAGDGFPGRFPPALRALAAWSQPAEDRPWRANICYAYPQSTITFAPECTPPRQPGTAQLLLWGDSHAAELYAGLLSLQSKGGFRVIQWTAAGCPPTRIALVSEQRGCDMRRAAALDGLLRVAPDTVLLAGAWEIYLERGDSPAAILAATDDVVAWLHRSGMRRVVLFGPGPTWNPTLPVDLFRYMSLRRTQQLPERLGWVPPEVRDLDAAMALRARAAHVQYVSPLERLCDAQGCRTQAHAGQAPPDLLFRDHDHLTVSGSRFLVAGAACQIFTAAACPASP